MILHSYLCNPLCFSSKSKETNIFPKHIVKLKARNKSNQTRKKLFCHVIVNNYLCNVFGKFLIKIEGAWRREIKEQAPQLTLLYCGRTTRSSHRRSSIKKLFLKILQYPQVTPVLQFLFKKVAVLRACTFIKKRPQHRWFPLNIAKILRLPISKNICERLFFDCFNGSLLHEPEGSRSVTWA